MSDRFPFSPATMRASAIAQAAVLLLSTGSFSFGGEETDKAISLSPHKLAALATWPGGGTGTRAASDLSGFSWSLTNRRAVLAAYFEHYMPSEGYAANVSWTGDVATCVPGTVSTTFLNDTLRRINYYRAQTGLPTDIVLNATKSQKAQWSALIMSRQGALSHFPATDWPANACVVDDISQHGTLGWGHEAAGSGNLSLGSYGPGSIDRLILDTGSNNAVAGHRRWQLYPQAAEMGVGAVPSVGGYNSSQTVWVIGNFKSAGQAPATVVHWPNAGYVPYQLIPRDGYGSPYCRWSCGFRNASFGSAAVSMSRVSPNPAPIATSLEPYGEGYADNTLVWLLSAPTDIPFGAPSVDTTYRVTITGITLNSGSPPPGFVSAGGGTYSYTYEVVSFNPYDLQETMTLSGNASPPVGAATNYTFAAVSGASSYRARWGSKVAGTWKEGAEDSPAPQVTPSISASYNLISSALARTGAKSFHLAVPSGGQPVQSFSVARLLLPTSSSRLQFWTRLRFFTTATAMIAELSLDEGASWSTLFSRPGDANSSSGSSSSWESTWQAADVAMPAEAAGKVCQLRFRLSVSGSYYPNTGDNYGCYIDDIQVTNSSEFTGATTAELASNASSFSFTPAVVGDFSLQIQPQIGETQWFGYGPLLDVTAVNSSGLPAWRQTHFGSSANSGLGADAEDPDHDGLANIVEYAFQSNPNVANLPAGLPVVHKNGASLDFVFTPDPAATGLTFLVQESTDLANWQPVSTTSSAGVYRATLSAGIRRYARLRVINAGGI